jgi:hypothetical protein
MESENTNYGLNEFAALVQSEDEAQQKVLQEYMREIAYIAVIASAFKKNTYLKSIIIFAHSRSWMEFTVADLENWLIGENSVSNDNSNVTAHAVLDAAIRGVRPPVQVLIAKNTDQFSSQKKVYDFHPKFQKYVKRFLNFIIQQKQ